MADVYRAYHPGLDRYVAIKVMHSHLSDDASFASRFQREAKSVAGLRHSNIVQVFDFDVQDDISFMVMEYIEGGRTLKEVLEKLSAQGQRLPVATTLEMTARLADALDYAHQRGMVHRDIKPSNVLLTQIDNPILSDFGIARLVGQTGLTSSGAMIGTPAYMSPEQGRGEKADERSDIYALGIVLYEMLTGQPPYDADTPYGVILKHINDPIIPPRMLVEGLPESVERVVLKCLAKAPEDRYQTGAELRQAAFAAINELQDSTPASASTPISVAAAPAVPRGEAMPVVDVTTPDDVYQVEVPSGGTSRESTEVRPAERPRPSRALIGVALAVLLLVCLGVVALGVLAANRLGGLSGGGGDATPDEEASGEGDGSEPIEVDNGDVDSLLSAGYQAQEEGDLDQAIAYFEQALALDPDNVEALLAAGWAYGDADRSEAQVAEVFNRALELEPDNPYALYAVGRLQQDSEKGSDPEAALASYTRAAELCGDDGDLCSDAYGAIARLHMWYFDQPESALEMINRALEYDTFDENRADRLILRAEIYQYGMEDLESALVDLEEIHTLLPEEWWPLEHGAKYSLEHGENDRAIEYVDRLLEMSGGELGYLVARGAIHRINGDLEAARHDAERSLELDPELLGGHYLLGLVLLDEGDPEAARAEFEIPHADNETFLEEWVYPFPLFSRDWDRDVHYDLARAAYEMGDLDGAQEYLDELFADDGEDFIPGYLLRGQILTDQGDLGGARQVYQQALEHAWEPEDVEEIERRMAELTG
jgi:serine/threonine-protein kinase